MSIRSVITSLEQSVSAYPSKEAFLHRCRVELEPFVYSYLKQTYGAVLSAYWDSCTIPLVSTKAIVIVERRCHPNLEFTLQNAVYFARGYSLHVICSEANRTFVEEVCGSQVASVHIHVAYTDIGTVESGKREYNALLKTYGFWTTFTEDYLLCMETDSYLLRPIPPIVYDYSYVASLWHWIPEQAGGGGITHRKRSFMEEICGIEALQKIEMQDVFASEGLLLKGYPFVNDIFAETRISHATVGTHQWWTFACGVPPAHRKEYISFLLTLEIDSTSLPGNSLP